MFDHPQQNAEFYGANLFRAEPSWRIVPHMHVTEGELICLLRGSYHVRSNGRVRDFSAGDVLFYPVGVQHEEWTDAQDPVEHVWIRFICPLDQATRGMVSVHDHRGRITDLTKWLLADTPTLHHVGVRAEANAIFKALLLEFDHAMRQDTQPAWVNRVRDHIRAHMAETLSVAVLAQVAGFSPYYFMRVYRKVTGRTVMDDVRSLRVHHARELILNTRLPHKQIAAQTGLGDMCALSRAFRRTYGVAPRTLRRPR